MHNEENTLKRVVLNCIKLGSVIVVDDCSTDSSIKILRKLKCKNLKILSNNNKLGYDGSINKGINFALKKFKFIVFDADDQFDYKDINKFIKYLKNIKLLLGYALISKDLLKTYLPLF